MFFAYLYKNNDKKVVLLNSFNREVSFFHWLKKKKIPHAYQKYTLEQVTWKFPEFFFFIFPSNNVLTEMNTREKNNASRVFSGINKIFGEPVLDFVTYPKATPPQIHRHVSPHTSLSTDREITSSKPMCSMNTIMGNNVTS